ncbi:hypothetical protein I2486_18495 [Cellulophaga sp. E16_2]|uniref:hypothetical protein n=1 Tax=Cellulophaga sp. E16_2 TaxID=2789297 RepID=UPI001A92FADD|nr:hypothetical protein [Cellulophaga sp. E16_2]MBO0593391.1 hypothetical protein [Cellulophaga sp. E16_2]
MNKLESLKLRHDLKKISNNTKKVVNEVLVQEKNNLKDIDLKQKIRLKKNTSLKRSLKLAKAKSDLRTFFNPIYTSEGNFRGYDSEGKGGDAIIYDGEFTTGANQKKILGNGGEFLNDLSGLKRWKFMDNGWGHFQTEKMNNQLDPYSVNQNALGLSYPGGDNPRTYGNDADYSFIPENLSEYPAIGHDRRYDNLGIEGASGLFKDPRAIGADYIFIKEELTIALNPFLPIKTRVFAGSFGVILGFCALPKTIKALIEPNGLDKIKEDFEISNRGVSNKPN